MATYESCEGMNSSQLTSYAEVFHASRTLSPGSAEPPMTTATSGPKCSESFARLNPDGSWLRMCQGYCQARLDGSLEEFSGTWPKAGIVLAGTAYQRQPLARRIEESESLSSQSWPTPRAGKITDEQEESWRKRQAKGDVATPPLTLAVKMWPTVTQSDGSGGPGCSGRSGGANLRTAAQWRTPTAGMVDQARGRDSQAMRKALDKGQSFPLAAQTHAEETASVQSGGQLNPDWVECLMGFPVGWTQLEHTSGPRGRDKHNTSGSRRG